MFLLDTKYPDIAERFREGKFTVSKTHNNFSSIAIDHAHEQNNKCIKGDGGVIGLTENSAQLLRWMVSGPKIARLVNKFKVDVSLVKLCEEKIENKRHHEQTKCAEKVQETSRSTVLSNCRNGESIF